MLEKRVKQHNKSVSLILLHATGNIYKYFVDSDKFTSRENFDTFFFQKKLFSDL